ncbi:isochorismate synthase MenF [Bacillus sp. GM2]|uniref:isochorismate synthase n=1 Tax=Bacillus TaxID=1386 RepID=UPI000952399D|nr:isochorismate synthase MenF [Bacillus paralicheniformis]MSN97226.1 isochorismate synthase [Bacillus paralicheniformis]MSO01235.1 isochorismate synthase [Bacillus paralicheniformis]MSO05228.1 isochorismate synthase [Bacillus paralicheniformis]MSO09221.1 isochorismate synthase [Bacillus paralicheniformis]NJE37455.1 isochorismate synthase [Bacillus paralicheniformis]
MVTTVQRTFLREAPEALNIVKKVNHAVLISYSRKIESIDALSFFINGEEQFAGKRFFWSDPDGGLTLVGLGKEVLVSTDLKDAGRYQAVHEKWERLKEKTFHFHEDQCTSQAAVGPLLFGGFSFDPLEDRKQHWNGYQEGAFFIPTAMLTQDGEETFITVNRWKAPEEDVRKVLEEIKSAASQLIKADDSRYPENSHARYTAKEELDVPEWLEAVRRATDDIKNGKYDKVVLAREILLTFDQPVELHRVLFNLMSEQKTSYIFAIEENGKSFVGASPERLVKKDGDNVLSTCLAGSIKRGESEQEDRMLGLELLNDEKNLIEHDIVVNMIHQALLSNCSNIKKPAKPGLYKTKNVQHLYTPIVGKINAESSLFDLIEKLHPTPALGGAPQQKAIEVIRVLEPMSRGWYAAPTGWIDMSGNGEFAVAIRSGLIDSKEARIFAGCGVVADSDPHMEYEETQIKMKPMLSALGGDIR